MQTSTNGAYPIGLFFSLANANRTSQNLPSARAPIFKPQNLHSHPMKRPLFLGNFKHRANPIGLLHLRLQTAVADQLVRAEVKTAPILLRHPTMIRPCFNITGNAVSCYIKNRFAMGRMPAGTILSYRIFTFSENLCIIKKEQKTVRNSQEIIVSAQPGLCFSGQTV